MQNQVGSYYAVMYKDIKSGKTQLSTNMKHIHVRYCLSQDKVRVAKALREQLKHDRRISYSGDLGTIKHEDTGNPQVWDDMSGKNWVTT